MRLFSLTDNPFTAWYGEATKRCLASCPDCLESYYRERASLFLRYSQSFDKNALDAFLTTIQIFDVGRLAEVLGAFALEPSIASGAPGGIRASTTVLMAIYETLYYARWIDHPRIKPLFTRILTSLILQKKMLKVHKLLGGLLVCLFHEAPAIRQWARSTIGGLAGERPSMPPDSYNPPEHNPTCRPPWMEVDEYEQSFAILLRTCSLTVVRDEILLQLPLQKITHVKSPWNAALLAALLENVAGESSSEVGRSILHRVLEIVQIETKSITPCDPWLLPMALVLEIYGDIGNPKLIQRLFEVCDGSYEILLRQLEDGFGKNFLRYRKVAGRIISLGCSSKRKIESKFIHHAATLAFKVDGEDVNSNVESIEAFQAAIKLLQLYIPEGVEKFHIIGKHLHGLIYNGPLNEAVLSSRKDLNIEFLKLYASTKLTPIDLRENIMMESLLFCLLFIKHPLPASINVGSFDGRLKHIMQIYPDVVLESLYKSARRLEKFTNLLSNADTWLRLEEVVLGKLTDSPQEVSSLLDQFPNRTILKLYALGSFLTALQAIPDCFRKSRIIDLSELTVFTHILNRFNVVVQSESDVTFFISQMVGSSGIARKIQGSVCWLQFFLKHSIGFRGSADEVKILLKSLTLLLRIGEAIKFSPGLDIAVGDLQVFLNRSSDPLNCGLLSELEAAVNRYKAVTGNYINLVIPKPSSGVSTSSRIGTVQIIRQDLEAEASNAIRLCAMRKAPGGPVIGNPSGSKLSQLRSEFQKETFNVPVVPVATKRKTPSIQAAHSVKTTKLEASHFDSDSDATDEVDHSYVMQKQSKEILKPEANRSVKVIDIVNPSCQTGASFTKTTPAASGEKIKDLLTIQQFHRFILSLDYADMTQGIQQVNENLPVKPIPQTFNDEKHYVEIFAPLLQLEARSQIIQAIADNGQQTSFTALINAVSNVDGFHEITLELTSGGNFSASGSSGRNEPSSTSTNEERTCSDNDLLLVEIEQKRVFGLVTKFVARAGNTLPRIVLRVLFEGPNASLQIALRNGLSLSLSRVCNVITNIREFMTLANFGNISMCKFILQPRFVSFEEGSRSCMADLADRLKINETQAKAILAVLNNPNPFTLIQGPPGTGKTRTIEALLGAILGRPYLDIPRRLKTSRVLVCAPSNAAVDEIVRRVKGGVRDLYGQHNSLNILRIGSWEMIHEEVKDVTFDALVERKFGATQQASVEMLEAQRNDISNLQRLLEAAERTMTGESEDRIRQLKGQLWKAKEAMKKNSKYIEESKQSLRLKILREAQVVCCTLSSSGVDLLSRMDFELVIIDEACQAVEPSALIPLQYKCRHAVLIGDPNQLPPTVISQGASAFAYEQSLFQRFQQVSPEGVHLLGIQYRMHPDISRFPNQYFYGGRLSDDPQVATRNQRPWHRVSLTGDGSRLPPVFLGTYRFFDCHGSERTHQRKSGMEGTSMMNELEAKMVLGLVVRLCCSSPNVNVPKGEPILA